MEAKSNELQVLKKDIQAVPFTRLIPMAIICDQAAQNQFAISSLIENTKQ